MKNIVFLLEEISAKEFLKNFLHRHFRNVDFKFLVFEGKSDLEKNIVRKLRGYNIPNAFFVILRDQDSAECRAVKRTLEEKCELAFKTKVLIRIACREIESWYFGNLNIVEKALDITGLKELKNKRKYRNTDNIIKPSEELMKITNNRYQKVLGSMEIGLIMPVEGNISKSFNVLLKGIDKIIQS